MFLRRNEKERPANFLVEIPFKDNEKKEKPKEVRDSNSLQIAQEIEIAKLAIFLDSQLLVNQIKGTFAVKQKSIKDYLQKVKTALRGFEEYTVEHVRRNQNNKVDALSNLTSMTFEHLTKEVLVQVLTKRSIEEKEVLKVDMQERKSLMDPIHEYLLSGLLPEDTKEARKIRIQASRYKLIQGNLTLLRNSQKETPFSLTYGSEAVVLIIESTYDRGRIKKATKGKESKEVASIEKAYYRNKLQKYHSARSSHPMYIVGDFILLKRNTNEWQGPYIINEVHKEEQPITRWFKQRKEQAIMERASQDKQEETLDLKMEQMME
ncbi:reverse transcriptase domain-containing protein [Tanacetum coccineum]